MAVSGTRGDVQPAVVLGSELQRRGHRVVMAVPPNLASFARGAGLDTVPLGYDTRAHMNSDLVRHGISRGSIADRARAVAALWNFGWDQMVHELTEVICTVRPDVVVTGITTEQIALPLAERFDAGLVALHHAPVRANARYSPIPGSESLPGVLTSAAWTAVDHLLWAATCHRENVFRRKLGIPIVTTPLPSRMARRGAVEIQAYDAAFCPGLSADWAATRPFVGFLEMSADIRSTSDAGVDRWIADGTPPVYVGFGSMPVQDPEDLVASVTTACARLGERVLISAGWNDITRFADHGEHVLVTGALDHERVFPQCRAVVHHGGAGSTAAGIRAARPTVICSVASDQPFWGRRIVEHGCGATMSASAITADSIEATLRIALSPAAADGARALSAAMSTREEAVRGAADSVESAR